MDAILSRILQMPAESDLKSLIKLASLGRIERTDFELKVNFDDSPRARGELCRTVVGMANSGGGVILFGISNDGTRVGLERSLSRILDPSNVTNLLRKRAPASRVETTYLETRWYTRLYGFLVIQPADTVTVFDAQWAYHDRERERIAVRPGVVYVRVPGATTPARQGDIDRLLSDLLTRRTREFVAKIEQVASLPPDAPLVVVSPDDPTQGFRMVGSGEGRPVRLVDSSDSAALPLVELLNPNVPFSSLDAEVVGQVRQWTQHDPQHRVPRKTLIRWYLHRDEMTTSPQVATFCLQAAAQEWGYPLYWASVLPPDHLRRWVEAELAKGKYPTRLSLPYLVGAFFWDERQALLEPSLSRLGATQGVARRVMSLQSFDAFKSRGRWSVNRVELADKAIPWEDLVSDQSLARSVFEELLSLELEDSLPQKLKGVINQLDILLHNREET